LKDENEYFTLHATNYFGDYQILLGLRASEFYKSSFDGATYCHCIKKKELSELLSTLPVARFIFSERASRRRIEFRRIRKQYIVLANIHPNPEQDKINIDDETKFKIHTYTDKSLEAEMPDFLTDPNFYFKLYNLKKDEEEDIEKLSDTELVDIKDNKKIAQQEKQSL